MDTSLIAPCGLNCALCSGYQRQKDRCGGCNSDNVRPGYCTSCSVKLCPEKAGDKTKICGPFCTTFPCRRLKDLEKRYRTKYGESLMENIALIEEIGLEAFAAREEVKWKCPQCGELLCVHKPNCLNCGNQNEHYPREAHARTAGMEKS